MKTSTSVNTWKLKSIFKQLKERCVGNVVYIQLLCYVSTSLGSHVPSLKTWVTRGGVWFPWPSNSIFFWSHRCKNNSFFSMAWSPLPLHSTLHCVSTLANVLAGPGSGFACLVLTLSHLSSVPHFDYPMSQSYMETFSQVYCFLQDSSSCLPKEELRILPSYLVDGSPKATLDWACFL